MRTSFNFDLANIGRGVIFCGMQINKQNFTITHSLCISQLFWYVSVVLVYLSCPGMSQLFWCVSVVLVCLSCPGMSQLFSYVSVVLVCLSCSGVR